MNVLTALLIAVPLSAATAGATVLVLAPGGSDHEPAPEPAAEVAALPAWQGELERLTEALAAQTERVAALETRLEARAAATRCCWPTLRRVTC